MMPTLCFPISVLVVDDVDLHCAENVEHDHVIVLPLRRLRDSGFAANASAPCQTPPV